MWKTQAFTVGLLDCIPSQDTEVRSLDWCSVDGPGGVQQHQPGCEVSHSVLSQASVSSGRTVQQPQGGSGYYPCHTWWPPQGDAGEYCWWKGSTWWFWLAWKMGVRIIISVRPASRLSVCGKNFNVAVFSYTINVINVIVMVALIELYPCIPLWVTLATFQGHISVKEF